MKRLSAVGKGLVRLGVHFDDYSVSTGGKRGASHRRDLVAYSRSMARIADDREVRQLVHCRDRGEVEHVPRRRIECPNAALTQNYLSVALGEDVLRAEQQVGDRCSHAPLEEHGLADPPDGLE